MRSLHVISFFFFNDTATTEIYTLSLHDALPICPGRSRPPGRSRGACWMVSRGSPRPGVPQERRSPVLVENRSEEHTSELQSRQYLVCRLLLEKKKKNKKL